jgi:uncharacterized membrane protein
LYASNTPIMMLYFYKQTIFYRRRTDNMRTPASVAGHPIHPMLIVFPIGLLVFSLLCDLVSMSSPHQETWGTVAFYTMVGGFIGALIAAIPGVIDFLAMTDARIKRIAVIHMALNLIAVTLYGVNIWLRIISSTNNGMPLILSIISVLILSASGWLGAEMVHKHGVGVDTDSILSNEHAKKQ